MNIDDLPNGSIVIQIKTNDGKVSALQGKLISLEVTYEHTEIPIGRHAPRFKTVPTGFTTVGARMERHDAEPLSKHIIAAARSAI